MEKKRRHKAAGITAAVAAAAILLTAGASGSEVQLIREKRKADVTLMPRGEERAVVEVRKAAPVSEIVEIDGPEENAPPLGPLPETAAVEDTYFSDAVFLGDSRTQGLQLYSGLKTGHFFTSVGATVQSAGKKECWELEDGKKITLLDAMKEQAWGKIYIMLGVNELGWTKTQTYHDQYAKLIDRVKDDHPGAKIVLQSLPPVSAKQDAKKSYVNNKRITEYNEIIESLAEEKNCYFLDAASCLTDKDGVLPEKQTSDGIHFNKAGCKTWLGYLRTHSLEADAIEAAVEG